MFPAYKSMSFVVFLILDVFLFKIPPIFTKRIIVSWIFFHLAFLQVEISSRLISKVPELKKEVVLQKSKNVFKHKNNYYYF